jgi:hypothetical protein
MILPCELGVGLPGRATSVVLELIAEGNVEVKSLRRPEFDESSLLTTGRAGNPCAKSLAFGSSLLLVCR